MTTAAARCEIEGDEYQRLKDENARLLRELQGLRPASAPVTILGLRDALLVIDEAGVVTYANVAAEAHFGTSHAELAGKQVGTLRSDHLDGALLEQLRQESLALRAPVQREVRSKSERPHQVCSVSITASPAAGGVQLLIEDRSELRQLEATLARYVSPRVLELVMKSGVDPYQARKYPLTVLFADLRGFTTVSEALSPEEVKKLIDEYLTVQIDIVLHEGATLDKIVGDSVMALFGAPLPVDNHAVWAINTALKMQEGHRRLIELWRRRGLPACPLGIGVNSGEMVVGHIGSKQQMNYTVLGHNVNVGARLCSAAEGGEILISQQTFVLARDLLARDPQVIWRPVKFVRGKVLNAKGIAEPVQTVSVVEV